MKINTTPLRNLFPFFIILYFLNTPLHSETVKPVSLTFVTHNEENENYTNFNYYILRRNIIVQLAEYVQLKGVKWDFQSDWKFLVAVKNFDTGSVIINTNGKNLIKWLVEDKGISCDPHAHESQYNYADVAYLHTQLGITPAKIVGGFLYDTIVGGNNWENLETGIYGRVYTSFFWKPDILWGGGTQNHLDDPQNYGIWKPKDMANFYVHDSSKHLTLIGNGCTNKIFDTTSVTTALNRVKFLVDAIKYNLIPDSGYYTSTVFMSVGQFGTSQLNKMKQFIDSVGVYVSQGRIQWKSIKDNYDYWNTSYGKNPFRLQCSDLPTQFSKLEMTAAPQGFYKESVNRLNMNDTFRICLRNISSPYNIVDSSKALIDSTSLTGYFAFKNAPSGTYYISLKHRNSIETWSKSGGIAFTVNSLMNYDFTSSSSQAYGNNLILKGMKYCTYSGDTDQDGTIDASDISIIDNDVIRALSGYLISDLNGDFITDADDMSIAENNSLNNIIKIIP
ncbi:MAG: hypothetical protein JST15_03970 [Bacteroidetes bacterium]|nr:hypothetical protein [Bacteroidota bacterium]